MFNNRIGWATTYLKKAGLIESTARATLHITERGIVALRQNSSSIDNEYLMQFESFRAFQNSTLPKSQENDRLEETSDTPDDLFEKSYKQITMNLAEDVLTEVMKLSPIAFEKMVLDLFSKMYGTSESAGYTTAVSGDEGIDGVIMEDKLGFSLIYIQAKKWSLDSTVGRPEVQGFVGAITGKGGKGLFVTTAKFSKQAMEYAHERHIILVDGQKLANLMLENNFCVSVRKTFEIKAIDTDAFNEYIE